MKSLKKALRRFLTKPVSGHIYMNSKSVDERLALISRAHSIYFSRCILINYEYIVSEWFKAAGFVVRETKEDITPYTAQITVYVSWLNTGSDSSSRIVRLFTKTA